ncbi:MAG TPA: hypothetical protein VGJ44_20925 [Kribbellaceae bacterium]
MSLLGELKRRFDDLRGERTSAGTTGVRPRERKVRRPVPAGEAVPGPVAAPLELNGVQRNAFLAVVEALQDHSDVVPASAEVGRKLADDGVPLPEALDGLHAAYSAVHGTEPAYDAIRALSQSWSESSLTYLHSLSCEDPLTGLASMAHLRSRLNELYREADLVGRPVSSTHALVMVEAPPAAGGTNVDRELRLVDIAECLRIVYCGGEVLGRIGLTRGAALVSRTDSLPEQVETVRALITSWRHEDGEDAPDDDLDDYPVPRVWIEGLPSSVEWAGRLLDELSR